jgi:hypothetical protein
VSLVRTEEEVVDDLRFSARSGDSWRVLLAAPLFVDGSEVVVDLYGGAGGDFIDGPRARGGAPLARRSTLPKILPWVRGLLRDGWSLAPPWHEAPDATEWFLARIAGSTLRPGAISDLVATIDRERLTRWVEAEQVVDLARVARALRVERLSLWREPRHSTAAWAACSVAPIDEEERLVLLSRFRTRIA